MVTEMECVPVPQDAGCEDKNNYTDREPRFFTPPKICKSHYLYPVLEEWPTASESPLRQLTSQISLSVKMAGPKVHLFELA
jgi:hypothetical protein